MDMSTTCSTWFEVGDRHLVNAALLAGLPFASQCPLLSDEVEVAVRRKHGIPPDYGRKRRHAPARRNCDVPATLDEAFQAADVVGRWDPEVSCVVPGGDIVEHVAVMRRSFKGLGQGEVLRVRVTSGVRERERDFGFSYELTQPTGYTWPPADFLRREGSTFVLDGCLAPPPPPSFEAGKEALLRLFPLPHDYRSRPVGRSSTQFRPKLSCSALDPSFFIDADEALNRYAFSVEHESIREARRSSGTIRDQGGCASCSLPPPGTTPSWAWLCLVVAGLSRRPGPKRPSVRNRGARLARRDVG